VAFPFVFFVASVRAVDEEKNASGEQAVAEKNENVAETIGDDNSVSFQLRESYWVKFQMETTLDGTADLGPPKEKSSLSHQVGCGHSRHRAVTTPRWLHSAW